MMNGQNYNYQKYSERLKTKNNINNEIHEFTLILESAE